MWMSKLRTNSGRPLHRGVEELCDGFLRGHIARRDFLQTAAWLGVSVASARAFVGLGIPEAHAAAPTPKRGGTLRFAALVEEMHKPSEVSHINPTNLFRNTLEYLTFVDANNITHPYLAASWDPSEDLKTWSFKLQPNVQWSNGDPFGAEDVAATIRRWISPESKSSNKTSFAALKQIEVKGPLEIVLHLDRPTLAIPEMLYAYTCPILHRDFVKNGADWPKNPIGTGAYNMVEFKVGQRAIFKRRDGYWGKPPYLDEIHYIDVGQDTAPQIAALASGQVDLLYSIGVKDLDLIKRLPNVVLLRQEHAAQTPVMRMRMDKEPWSDRRLRRAVQLCANNEQMLKIAFRGEGSLARDFHVAPFQPAYYDLPPVKRDVAQAKHLLAEAGHGAGLDVTMLVGNATGTWEQDTAQVLQQNCTEAGIRIHLNVVPPAAYWPQWNKALFSLTFWAHRPLAVMTLDLGYRSGGAWNESHFSNKDFDAALSHAMSIIDPKARSKALQPVERILQDSAVIVQPYWMYLFSAKASKVQGFVLHPSQYYDMRETWLS